MIAIYGVLLTCLRVLLWLVRWRAGALEQRYAAAAKTCLALTGELPRSGTGKADAAQSAKRQYQLGAAVQHRDHLEAKYERWQGWADGLNARITALREWRGRKVPYLLGAADVFLLATLCDYCNSGQPLSYRTIAEWVSQWLQR
jgi:hypothetical protein